MLVLTRSYTLIYVLAVEDDAWLVPTAAELRGITTKIKGPEKIRDTLGELANVITEYERSSRKLNEMIEALDNGYTSFHL